MFYFIIQTSGTILNSINFLKTKNKKKLIDYTGFFNLQNNPTFHSEQRW